MSVLRQDNVFIIKFSLSPRKFFGAKLTETAKIIIIIIIVRNEILSVLGLDSEYTVKYSPSPFGVLSGKGLYLIVYPSSRPNTDTVSESLNVINLLHLDLDSLTCPLASLEFRKNQSNQVSRWQKSS